MNNKYTKEELRNLTLSQLKDFAKSLGVINYLSLNREELIDSLVLAVFGNQNSEFIVQDETEKATSNNLILPSLSVNSTIKLREKKYVIKEIISNFSSQTTLYKVSDTENNCYIFKTYEAIKHIDEGNTIEVLHRIKKINEFNILKLLDFGEFLIEKSNTVRYELMEFAEGGNLLQVDNYKQKYSPDFLFRQFIPEILTGINTLHNQNIYHCDIKPSNIYFLSKEKVSIVIGDYSSAIFFEGGLSKGVKFFPNLIGTRPYSAPEQANGIISQKVDYYSMGMVLLHLLYPEFFALDDDFSLIDYRKVSDIKINQYLQLPVIPYSEKYHKINQIIHGLTLYDHAKRWGNSEVLDWLSENSEIKLDFSDSELMDVAKDNSSNKSKTTAIIMAIFLGFLGGHFFYMNKYIHGFIFFIVSIFSIFIKIWEIPIFLSAIGIIYALRYNSISSEHFSEDKKAS